VEGADGQVLVHVRPGADANGVDRRVVVDVVRVGRDLLDAELIGDALAALHGAVAYPGKLDVGQGLEAGDVTAAGVGARTDEANPDLVSHSGLLNCKTTAVNRLLRDDMLGPPRRTEQSELNHEGSRSLRI